MALPDTFPYTVSINVRSTLLNTSIDSTPNMIVNAAETAMLPGTMVPCPNTAYLNISTGAVTGLISTTVLIQPSDSCDSGYTTGVAYIHSDTPKVTSTLKSRYLVVTLDIIMPHSMPMSPIHISMTGSSSQYIQWGITTPAAQYITSSTATSIMEIPNLIIADSTLEIGTVRRGKYILPNSPALPVNVLALLVRHDENSPHIAVPDR